MSPPFLRWTLNTQPTGYRDQHDVIHLGGKTPGVVPLDEYRRLPGALSHEEVMAELLGGGG